MKWLLSLVHHYIPNSWYRALHRAGVQYVLRRTADCISGDLLRFTSELCT